MQKKNLVITSDGRLADRDDVLPYDGSDGQQIAEEKIPLTTREKIQLRDFMNSDMAQSFVNNSNFTKEQQEARKKILETQAKKELLYLRETNDERVRKGEKRLSEEDRRLLVAKGVVISVYRNNEQQKMYADRFQSNRKSVSYE